LRSPFLFCHCRFYKTLYGCRWRSPSQEIEDWWRGAGHRSFACSWAWVACFFEGLSGTLIRVPKVNRPDYSGGCLVSMSSPFFPDLRKDLGRFLVDKTKLIEDIVDSRMHGKVDLVLRPRRCGKSTMLQMIKWLYLLAFHTLFWNLSSRSFFSVPLDGIDLPHLFSGLYIAEKQEICREHMGQYRVIFLDFQVCYSLELCRVLAYMKQLIYGTSWDRMLTSFKMMAVDLYEKWREYLWDSLSEWKQIIFQSLEDMKASDTILSLKLLSQLLAKKSGHKVIVLIDEYEAPNNRAYEHGFFNEVRSLRPPRSHSSLTTLIQANEFFGRGVLPPFLKVAKIYPIFAAEHLTYLFRRMNISHMGF